MEAAWKDSGMTAEDDSLSKTQFSVLIELVKIICSPCVTNYSTLSFLNDDILTNQRQLKNETIAGLVNTSSLKSESVE